MAYPMASLRMAVSLAFADVSICSDGEMRLARLVSEAEDQSAAQAGSSNRAANSLSRKSAMSAAAIPAASGSSCAKPKRAANAASRASFGAPA
jgi:hypothetical protein